MYSHIQVKFAELTLDTYRMMQCLEWEPSGLFYQKQPVQSNENGSTIDHSGASGIIDINLGMDLTDSSLPRNPRKTVLYRPSVTQLIAVSSGSTFSYFDLMHLLCSSQLGFDHGNCLAWSPLLQKSWMLIWRNYLKGLDQLVCIVRGFLIESLSFVCSYRTFLSSKWLTCCNSKLKVNHGSTLLVLMA